MEAIVILFIVLIFFIIKGLYFLALGVILFIPTTIYFIYRKFSFHDRAETFSELAEDDYVETVCDMVKDQGFQNVHRLDNDRNVIIGSYNHENCLWVVLKGKKMYESKSMMLLKNIADRYSAKRVRFYYYKSDFTETARKYAREEGIVLVGNDSFAIEYRNTKKGWVTPESVNLPERG